MKLYELYNKYGDEMFVSPEFKLIAENRYHYEFRLATNNLVLFSEDYNQEYRLFTKYFEDINKTPSHLHDLIVRTCSGVLQKYGVKGKDFNIDYVLEDFNDIYTISKKEDYYFKVNDLESTIYFKNSIYINNHYSSIFTELMFEVVKGVQYFSLNYWVDSLGYCYIEMKHKTPDSYTKNLELNNFVEKNVIVFKFKINDISAIRYMLNDYFSYYCFIHFYKEKMEKVFGEKSIDFEFFKDNYNTYDMLKC